MNKRGMILLLITTIGSIIYSQYKKDLATAKERISSTTHRHQIIKTEKCGTIEYGIDGPNDAVQTIFIIHGSGGGFDQGLLIGKSFVEKGFRIIAPSRFDYLSSAPPMNSATVSDQADAYKCLLDELHVVKVDAVFGVSAGTPSALKFAYKHPNYTSSLILSVPGLHVSHPKTKKKHCFNYHLA